MYNKLVYELGQVDLSFIESSKCSIFGVSFIGGSTVVSFFTQPSLHF